MGARFTKIQPIQPVTIESGRIKVTDILGKIHIIQLPIDFTVKEEDITDFREDVFVNIIQGAIQLVLRKDMTWSLIHNRSRLLLDVGSYEFEGADLFYTEYGQIGYMSANGKVSAIMLDLANRRLVHGMRGPTMSNGFDFILKEPFPDIVDISPEVSSSFANTSKDIRPILHIWTTALREVEVKYDVLARNFQI